MAAEAITPLPGYQNEFGSKKAEVFELNGPTLYAPGAGQIISASTLGWGGFDYVNVEGRSLSGTYYGVVQRRPTDAAPSVPAGCTPTGGIIWYVVATGVEAGALDLSTEILRLFALGV